MELASPAYPTSLYSMDGVSHARIPLILPAWSQPSTTSALPVKTATTSIEVLAKLSTLSAEPVKLSEEPVFHATQAMFSTTATVLAFRSNLLVRLTISTQSASPATIDSIWLLEYVCLLVLYASLTIQRQDNASIASRATVCLR